MQSAGDESVLLANPHRPTFLDRQLLRELDNGRRKAYLYFALALFFVLGTQNMIQPPTTSTFIDSVSYSKIPLAQSLLPLVYLPILFFYNFLFATFKSNPAIMVTIFCLLFAVIYWVLAIGSLTAEGGRLDPGLAYIFFYASNTKSVLFPVMFWSIMNDISAGTTADGTSFSKIAYPALVFTGQLGGIVGSVIAGSNQYLGGTPMLIIIQAVILMIVPVLVWRGAKLSALAEGSMESSDSPDEVSIQSVRPAANASDELSRQRGGACTRGCNAFRHQMWEIVEGLYLISTHPVLLGIFWIAAAHLVPRVILDYQGTGVVNWKWPKGPHDHPNVENKNMQTAFFAYCNLANNIGSMLLSMLGLRAIIEKGGLALGLIACPLVAITSVLIVCFIGSEQSMTRFWTVQIVLVFVNVVQYALNGPCREMLYVRCSKDIKYKAKSWADMYGNLLQKTIASLINIYVNNEQFRPVWTGIYCSVWTAVWVVIALVLGGYHTRLEKNNLLIGKDEIGLWPCMQVGTHKTLTATSLQPIAWKEEARSG